MCDVKSIRKQHRNIFSRMTEQELSDAITELMDVFKTRMMTGGSHIALEVAMDVFKKRMKDVYDYS